MTCVQMMFWVRPWRRTQVTNRRSYSKEDVFDARKHSCVGNLIPSFRMFLNIFLNLKRLLEGRYFWRENIVVIVIAFLEVDWFSSFFWFWSYARIFLVCSMVVLLMDYAWVHALVFSSVVIWTHASWEWNLIFLMLVLLLDAAWEWGWITLNSSHMIRCYMKGWFTFSNGSPIIGCFI